MPDHTETLMSDEDREAEQAKHWRQHWPDKPSWVRLSLPPKEMKKKGVKKWGKEIELKLEKQLPEIIKRRNNLVIYGTTHPEALVAWHRPWYRRLSFWYWLILAAVAVAVVAKWGRFLP